ncbi:protocadherin gamma-A11-like isoform X2 [Synchiropus splendidus]|uniref:protocadherin gamma-A11-like isoform X2 n=1 Tax=Synchiropus splendidus TaxID=270530 RepID=UPI00237DFD33|nr:protocadherin gamma-A11-like isoform X2 [Synchiropus splendidus]
MELCGFIAGGLRWRSFHGLRQQLGALLFLLCVVNMVGGQIRYSIPEEMKKGSVIGNVAQDLGLDVRRLRSGRARIVTGENIQYTELKTDKGLLVVNERIDREQLCGDVTPCSFSFEMILENPMELHQITIEVLDINDHAPVFPHDDKSLALKISEAALVGGQFPLQRAKDLDVGDNSLKDYILSPNDNFVLKQQINSDGSKSIAMILQKPLDREKQPHLNFKLIAVDGGTPQRSGSVNIDITVLDANDNVPIFNQTVYKVSVMENVLKGTNIVRVNATDADSGSNGLITYSLSNSESDIFEIDENTGYISVSAQLDYEKERKYEFNVEAKDQGGFVGSSKVVVDVTDVNDNAPVLNIMSILNPVSEDSQPGTTIAIFNIKDSDSEQNGQIKCSIEGKLPFKIGSSMKHYYNLVSDQYFDREEIQEYNISVIATDSGDPPLFTSRIINLKISDVNDNPPVFDNNIYSASITENNSPGVSIFAVSAHDSDLNQNARISYILEDTEVSGAPVSTYVSLNSETGVISAVRTFDYEQIKELQLTVKAQDGGSPPLSSNVTVKILIQDQNDNPPQVLYPVQTGGSLVAEMVPRSADVGYLVTKVVAVDVDSGQNAWLSYKLQRATDRPLFEVGLQNGEVRTIRQVTDKDAVKQRLSVTVEDNGQPSRSATVIVNVAVADSFPEVMSEFTDFAQDKEYNDNLTFYLVLALAVVSFLFITCLVVIISVKIYRWRQSRVLYHSNLPVIPYYPPRYSDTLGTGTLQHVYNYEVCRTTDSRKSDMKFMPPMSDSLVSVDGADADDPRVEKQMSGNFSQMSTLNPISEDSLPGTTIAVFNIKDSDSGENGQVKCSVDRNFPFKIQSSMKDYYNLVSDQFFDREKRPDYNITVTATDSGNPALTTSKILHLKISDVNDNPPVFDRNKYSASVTENNSPGVSIFAVRAHDSDLNQNARISYILEDTEVSGAPVSTYVSLNSETGVISAVRTFDYEQIKELQLTVKAQDGGSPPLSSNVTVKILIQDQNDNPPQVLYPVQTGGSLVAEMVPRSADVGYLVTKVVAVDVDSGQNAWLSYKLQRATDRPLFEVGLQNGEIRTIRQVTDKDAVKQRLSVTVEDNGQPSRSATVIVNVAVADSFPEVMSEFTDFTQDKEYNDNLTFYLVLALAVVSFLFITCLVVIISVKIYRWRQSRVLYHSNLPVIPYYPPRYSDTLGTGTLQHVYNYEVCRTTDSRKSDMKFMPPMSDSLVSVDGADADDPRVEKDMSGNFSQMSTLQKPPNNDWRFNQGQRPGPSGPHMPYGTHIRWTPKSGTRAAGGPEVAMGTGPWPQPPTEAEQLQALMAAANVSEATGTLGPGTMGLSTRYSPQFTLQHVPDYRQNVYIPGSTATLTSNPQQQQATAQQATQQALPPPQTPGQPEAPKAAQTPASKKKSTKKEKK